MTSYNKANKTTLEKWNSLLKIAHTTLLNELNRTIGRTWSVGHIRTGNFLNFGFHPPPVFLFSLKVLSYCICPSDLFRCGPIWRGALRFFRCNSNTHDEGKAGGKNGSHKKKKKKWKKTGRRAALCDEIWERWNRIRFAVIQLRAWNRVISTLSFFSNSRTKPNNK